MIVFPLPDARPRGGGGALHGSSGNGCAGPAGERQWSLEAWMPRSAAIAALAIALLYGPAAAEELWLTTDAAETTLTVASQRHDFVVFLPFNDDWTLESDEQELLTATNPRYTATLSRRALTDDPPRAVLEQALDELLSEDARVRFLQFIERDGRDVLTLQVRHSETGPWHWFYWTLIPADGAWLQMTVIDVDPGELVPLDADLVETMARGSSLKLLLGDTDRANR
jgi:hypothetical protein